MNSNDPCIMARMALRNHTDCNDALTAITDTTMRVTSRATLNQTNNYLKILCNNRECANTISNYFNTCQSLIVSVYSTSDLLSKLSSIIMDANVYIDYDILITVHKYDIRSCTFMLSTKFY